MKTSKKIGLNIPESEDFVDVGKLAENFEKIDEKFGKLVSTEPNQDLTEEEKANARSNIGAGESGFSGDYSDLKNIPAEFNPTTHTHTSKEVGLGNVPNVATNDQKPTYTEASSLSELTSGENISVAFGKIKKAISSLIAHIGDKISHVTSEEKTIWNWSNHTSVSRYHIYDDDTDLYKIANIKSTSSSDEATSGVDIEIPSEYLVTPEEKKLWTSKTSVSVIKHYLGEGTKLATIVLKQLGSSEEHEIDIVSPNTGSVTITNDLNTSETGTALDAVQGKKLKDMIDKKSIFMVVAKDGTGDFTTLTEAFDSYSEGDDVRIYLKSGVYEEVIYITNKYNSVILIGEHRDLCVLQDLTGIYKNSPLVVSGNFYIENLTIKAIASSSFTPTYDTNDVENTFPSYALHIDWYNYDENRTEYGYVHNCVLYSSAYPAVGMGTQKNQVVEFSDCKIIRDTTIDEYKQGENWSGSFLCHSSNDADAVNQCLILRNNYFECNFGYSATIRGELGTPSNFTVQALDNRFYSKENGLDSVKYTKSTSNLHASSSGNTASNLNAIEETVTVTTTKWTLLYENNALSSNSNYPFSKSISSATEIMFVFGLVNNGEMMTYWRETVIMPLSLSSYGGHVNIHGANPATECRDLHFSAGTDSFATAALTQVGWSGLDLGVKIYYR